MKDGPEDIDERRGFTSESDCSDSDIGRHRSSGWAGLEEQHGRRLRRGRRYQRRPRSE